MQRGGRCLAEGGSSSVNNMICCSTPDSDLQQTPALSNGSRQTCDDNLGLPSITSDADRLTCGAAHRCSPAR